ncbi:MAG: biotin--[acetyl-CoA-carboxylase] ligase [Pseudomonadota bacterium]
MSADWPEGVGRRILASVDSTNAEAIRMAGRSVTPMWILALEQTAAHGRRGRSWWMSRGNFAGTLLMQPNGRADRNALWSFVAALALHDALGVSANRTGELALKWPNDVLLNGGKVAGILLEALGHGQEMSHLVIGIGVNLSAAPDRDHVEPEAMRPVSLLAETGVQITPEAFLNLLAPAFARWEKKFTTCGFDPIRTAWLERAANLGEPVTARLLKETVTGVFETLDQTGALILLTPRGHRTIRAADIFF